MHPPRSVTPVLIAGIALLGGCTQFEWHKAGAVAEARDRDIADCSSQTRMEALRLAPMLQPPGPRIVIDRFGNAFQVHTTRREDERFLMEQDFMRACMRKRGYTLQQSTPQAS